jgi:hypothetical protein
MSKNRERLMLTLLRVPDDDAHEADCLAEDNIECKDANLEYLDIFCECHSYTEPKILSNGTDIAWPAGWSRAQAEQWRSAHGLVPLVECTDDCEDEEKFFGVFSVGLAGQGRSERADRP